VATNDQGGEVGGERGKHARNEEEDGTVVPRNKKPRVEYEMELQEQTLHVVVDPPEMPAAPGRHGEVPEVVVTPAVTELPKRRTSPQQLNLEEAAADPALGLPDLVQQDAPDVQDHTHQDVAQAGAPEPEFLQPLVPAEPPKGGKGRRKANTGSQVDERAQLRQQDIKWNMTPEGWNRNLRFGDAVQDLVELPDEVKVYKEWGEELGGRIKELLRRRASAPRWGFEGAEGDIREQRAADDGAAVATGDNEVQMGQERLEEVERERQDALEVSRDVSDPLGLAARNRERSLQRNSLQLDDVQAGDATGQDQVGVDVLGGSQDFLQTGEQLNLDITPERHPLTRDGGLAQALSPVQPDALLAGNDELPIGQELPMQDQNMSLAGGAQGGEEAIVTEFSLLASIQDFEEQGITPVTFTRLCPLASTRCMKAATTFQGILKLERAAKVVALQEQNYAEITIASVV